MGRRVAAASAAATVTILLVAGSAWSASTWGGAPVDLTPPSIAGTLQVGSKLTGRHGTWQGRSLKYAYAWLRCDSTGANCSSTGATRSSYVLVLGDAGATMRVVVTASNSYGSARAMSAATSAVPSTVAATAPANTSPPTISGSTEQGQMLTATPGSWSGSTPLSYAYQWQRCDAVGAACAPISGASGPAYVIALTDAGKTVRVSVTASNSAGSAMATSAATGVVPQPATFTPPTPPSNNLVPAISGTSQQAQTLSASAGSWSGTAPLTYAYQWQRCNSSGASCVPVASATGTTYLLASVDVGSTIRVSVTASNSAGSATAASAATAVIASPPTNNSVPSISGTTQSGQTLTATAGSWSGTAPLTYAYQWQRCNSSGTACVAVATGTTYVLALADVGSTLRVSVTASNSAGSATATSFATAVVAALPASNPPTSSSYFVGDFEGASLASWDHVDDSNRQGVIRTVNSPVDQGSYSGQLTVTPTAQSSPAANSDSVFLWNNAETWDGYQNVGTTTWYRADVYFPSSAYAPTTGNWNWFIEHHNDNGYMAWSCASAEKANLAWDVVTDYPAVQYQVGSNPHLELRVMGGQSCTPSTKWFDFGALKFDHWYRLSYQVKWDPSSAGFAKVYVDGVLAASYSGPTLFTRPDGSISYTNFDLANYRWHANWNSTIYFDNVQIGPN